MQRLLEPINTRLANLEQHISTDSDNPFHSQPQQSNLSQAEQQAEQPEQPRRAIPQHRQQPRRNLPQPRRGRWINTFDDDEAEQFQHEQWDVDRTARRQQRPRDDDSISGIKMRIPSFNGKSDPDAYFDWERKIELIFDCHTYSERNKVKLAATEFSDYALIWWEQIATNRRRTGERPIDTWDEMKVVMRKRFIPSHYYRDMFNRLQRLRQGTRTVEEYFQDLEMTLIRTGVDEEREATMARFLNGLRRDIARHVELQQFIDIEDMVHMAIAVEKQLKTDFTRHRFPDKAPSPFPSAFPKINERTFSTPFHTKPQTATQTNPPTAPQSAPINKGKAPASTTPRNRDITCFKCCGKGHITAKCPNKRTMILRDDGDIVTEDEAENVLKFC